MQDPRPRGRDVPSVVSQEVTDHANEAELFAALAVRLYRPMVFGRELHEISPSTSPAVGTSGGARRLVLGSGVEHLAEDHLEDAPVAVVVNFGRHVDPNRGRERDL
jgi:hypothetical protein